MLEAARASAESPPADIELTFVASGAEEQGLVGARRLVEDKVLPMDAMVLNLDMLGAGSQAYVVEGNGVFRRTKTSPKLNEVLSSCIRGVGIRPKLWWAALAGHDHIPFVRAKIDATTFTIDTKADKDQIGNFVAKAFRLPTAHVRGYRYIHTIEDIPDRIELDNIELAGKVVLDFIKAIQVT
jgi:Zn-dependent M28 family amino/carboxypeptidase